MSSKGFFVFTMTRSGSTWFEMLLAQQPGVAAYEELMLNRAVRPEAAWVAEGSPERFYVRRPELGSLRPMQLWRYLDEVRAHRPEARAYGFKLMVSQLPTVPELLPILAARGFRMVLLTRDNAFESAVSRLVMGATGKFHSREAARADLCIRLEPGDLIRQIRVRRRSIAAMRVIRRLWPAPSAEVLYGELVADQAGALGRVLRTLGVEEAPRMVEAPTKRRIAKPYAELIENWTEVTAALRQAGLGDVLPAERV